MSLELRERLSRGHLAKINEIKVFLKTIDEETDYRLSKSIIKLIKPIEEEAKTVEEEKGRKIFFREYSIKDETGEVAYKLITGLNACFLLKLSENRIEIEEIECPPCEKDAYSKIPEKHYLLGDGKIVEEIEESAFKVYSCRVKPPKIKN